MRRIWPLAIGETVAWGLLHYSFNTLLARGYAIAGGISLALFASAVAAPIVARSIVRFGARRVMVAGALLAVGSLVGLAVNGSYLWWMLLGIAQGATLYEPAFVAIARWFPDDGARRRAIVVVTVCGGLASTIFVPVVSGLASRLDWRPVLLLLAGATLVTVVPAYASLPASKTFARTEPARSARRFGLLAFVFAAQSFVATGATVHLVRELASRGRSLEHAAGIAALVGVSQVLARLVVGRVVGASTGTRIAGAFVAQALALVLVLSSSDVVAGAGVVLFGVTNGTLTVDRPMAVLERCGESAFAASSGWIAAVASLAKAAAPVVVTAVVANAGGSCAFVGLAICLAITAVIFRASIDAPVRLWRRDHGC